MSLKTTVQKNSTLIEILIELYPQSPRTRIKKLLHNNKVYCNAKVVTHHSFQLKPGDVIEINTTPDKAAAYASAPFKVLYDDPDVIVIDKPAGISTSSIDNSSNVYYILSRYLKEQSNGSIKAHVVHRLDKEVSGVLLFAKSEQAMEIIKDNWKETSKLYYALVEGKPDNPEGTIESFLVEDHKNKVHSIQTPSEKAKFAITHYRTIKQVENNTLLEINLETGRKNQIRVHLSDIGCPIIGDWKYGASSDFKRRIRLHAFSLSFPHPFSKENITVESPLTRGFFILKNEDEVYK